MNRSALMVFLSFLFVPPTVHSGTVMVPGVPGGNFTVAVKSFKELRFATTVRQQYDFSCGSAALATLLTYHYEDPVTEQEVFKDMFAAGDKAKIREQGFSLLDIKKYLQVRGYAADGFRTSLDKLAAARVPAITLISQENYRHFVVIKGITADEVLIGDPSRGMKKVTRAEFEKMWNGLLFLIRDKKQVANEHFNMQADWKSVPKAPLGLALTSSELANVTWLLPGPNDF